MGNFIDLGQNVMNKILSMGRRIEYWLGFIYQLSGTNPAAMEAVGDCQRQLEHRQLA